MLRGCGGEPLGSRSQLHFPSRHGMPGWDSETQALRPTCCVMLGSSPASLKQRPTCSPGLLRSLKIFSSPSLTVGLLPEPIPQADGLQLSWLETEPEMQR